MKFDSLLNSIEKKLSSGVSQKEGLQFICQLLFDCIDHYDWVGYYLHNAEKKELVLKAYVGKPTDHTHIPFGKGICGQVALSNQNFIVDDEKILAKIEENKKKPQKKGGFSARLQQAMEQAEKQKKARGKR